METTLQDSLLKAISTVVDTRINDLALDKTVVCIIDKVLDSTKGSYRVKYDGGTFTAFSRNNDEIYQRGMAVLVQIPQNNMSNEKNIISRAWVNRSDIENGVISPYLKDYARVGWANVVNDGDKTWSLNSYGPETNNGMLIKTLYKDNGVTHNPKEFDIRTQDLKTYLKEGIALLIEADFTTSNLSEEQKYSSGNYGLKITIGRMNPYNGLSTYGEFLNSYSKNIIEKDIENNKIKDQLSIHINNIKSKLQNNFTNKIDKKADICGEGSYIDIEINEIKTLIEYYSINFPHEYTDQMKENIESYLLMLEEIKSADDKKLTGHYFYVNYLAKWENTPLFEDINKLENEYILDSEMMVGNPYNLSGTTQYLIIPMTSDIFNYIKQIDFYKKGFNVRSGITAEDISVSNIKIYALKESPEINGGYQLKLSSDNGLIFEINDPDDKTTKISATVTKLYYEDLTNNVTFYWFKKSSKIKKNTDKGYHELGGLGWFLLSKKDKDSNWQYTIEKSDLGKVTYDNRYKVVAKIDDNTSLTEEFSIYNNKFKTNYRLVCDPGVDLIDNQDNKVYIQVEIEEEQHFYKHDDNNSHSNWAWNNNKVENYPEYNYIWTFKKDSGGDTIYDISYYIPTTSECKSYSNEIDEKYATRIGFPINSKNDGPNINLNGSLEVTCEIQKFISITSSGKPSYGSLGTVSTTLYLRPMGAPVRNYWIEIENGDQIFQYDEYGDAPNSEKLANPVEIKPLIAHFYSRAGKEENTGSYSVEWELPSKELSFIKDGPSIIKLRQCEFNIKETYNPNYTDNQIICRVTQSNGQIRTQRTNFLFTKIGNMNTNGSDIVARIIPRDDKLPYNNNEPLTLYHYKEGDTNIFRLNSGNIYKNISSIDIQEKIIDNTLKVQLYENSELIYDSTLDSLKEEATTKWSIVGGNSKYIDNSFNWTIVEKSMKGNLNNFILRAEIEKADDGKIYYAFYPLCYVEYTDKLSNSKNDKMDYAWNNKITIDNKTLLREIIYNSQGSNPTYNSNKGALLTFTNLNRDNRTAWQVDWETLGSKKNSSDPSKTSAFFSIIEDSITENIVGNNKTISIKIKPDSTYIGGRGDNVLRATLKNGRDEPLAYVYIPIYMGLNRSELESINNWDGNSIVIDENKTEILAPQIGVGRKDNDNHFTGLVMGQKNTYSYSEKGTKQTTSRTGLFGYLQGLQTLSLNAETGEAIFGLPEGYTLDSNGKLINQNSDSEGRIVIKPGGVSTIGGWGIGQTKLYYAVDTREDKTLVKPKIVENHFDHNQKGILLQSGPTPRIIIKGTNFDTIDSAEGDNPQIINGNQNKQSFELVIDPNKKEFFNLYKHYLKITSNDDGTSTKEWTTKSLIGIDAQGRFFTNSLRDHQASLFLGSISAFNKNVNDKAYFGLNLTYNNVSNSNNTLLKIFTDEGESISTDNDIYIATGNNKNSYQRSINLYGKNIQLYAKNRGTEKETPSFIKISDNEAQIQTGNNDSDITTKLALNEDRSLLKTISPFDLTSNQEIQIISNMDGKKSENSKDNHIFLGTSHDDGIDLYGGKLIGKFSREIQFDNGSYINFNNTGNINFVITNNSSREFSIKQIKEDKNEDQEDINVFELLLNKNTGKIHLDDIDNMHLFELSTEHRNKWYVNKPIGIISDQTGGIPIISDASNSTNKILIKSVSNTGNEGYGTSSDETEHQLAIVAESGGTTKYRTAMYMNSSQTGYRTFTLDEKKNPISHVPLAFYFGQSGDTVNEEAHLGSLKVIISRGGSRAPYTPISTFAATGMNITTTQGIQAVGHLDVLDLPTRLIKYGYSNSATDHKYDIRLDATEKREGLRNSDDRYGEIQSHIYLGDYFGTLRPEDSIYATFEGGVFRGANLNVTTDKNNITNIANLGNAKFFGDIFYGETFRGKGTQSNSAKYEGNEFKGMTFKGWDGISAKFIGNGSQVTNTYDGSSASPSISGSSGLGGTIYITIPSASYDKNIRPTFSTGTVSFTLPTAAEIIEAIKGDLKTYFDKIYAPYGHDHTATVTVTDKVYLTKPSSNLVDKNNVSFSPYIGTSTSPGTDITPTITVKVNGNTVPDNS